MYCNVYTYDIGKADFMQCILEVKTPQYTYYMAQDW